MSVHTLHDAWMFCYIQDFLVDKTYFMGKHQTTGLMLIPQDRLLCTAGQCSSLRLIVFTEVSLFMVAVTQCSVTQIHFEGDIHWP